MGLQFLDNSLPADLTQRPQYASETGDCYPLQFLVTKILILPAHPHLLIWEFSSVEPVVEPFGYRNSHLLFLYCSVILLPTLIARYDFHDRTVRESDLDHPLIPLHLPYEPKISDGEFHDRLSLL